jgi:hypothetical protein
MHLQIASADASLADAVLQVVLAQAGQGAHK